jgi:hypothetical protein
MTVSLAGAMALLNQPDRDILICCDEARSGIVERLAGGPATRAESCLQTTRQAAEAARYVYVSSLTPITLRERISHGNPHAYPPIWREA